MADLLIRLTGVALTYSGPPEVIALRPCDLGVRRGEFVVIVGPSGSGKSTLLNVLGLLDRPTAGRYEFDGVDTAAMTEVRRTQLRARQIGFVFQSFHLMPHRTVVDNVALALVYQQVPVRRRRLAAREALSQVGLGDRAEATPLALSGGEQQRVAIARALVADPSLLLCDEPTGNLDTATAETVMSIVTKLHASGLTVLVATHDRDLAGRAQRVVRVRDGRLAEL